MSTWNSLPKMPWEQVCQGDSETGWCHREHTIIPPKPIPLYTILAFPGLMIYCLS